MNSDEKQLDREVLDFLKETKKDPPSGGRVHNLFGADYQETAVSDSLNRLVRKGKVRMVGNRYRYVGLKERLW